MAADVPDEWAGWRISVAGPTLPDGAIRELESRRRELLGRRCPHWGVARKKPGGNHPAGPAGYGAGRGIQAGSFVARRPRVLDRPIPRALPGGKECRADWRRSAKPAQRRQPRTSDSGIVKPFSRNQRAAPGWNGRKLFLPTFSGTVSFAAAVACTIAAF